MLEQIWNWFLDLTSKLVIPDWGGLVALLPVGVMAVVIVWLVFTIRRLRGAPPARRGKQRVPPRTPAGIHMPGPSFAPVFAAIGTGLLMLGLVFGGAILWLGVLALVLTLLYWFAEAMRLYDHDVEPTVPALPAVIHEGPPPGVHMPGPSFRPIIGAIGMGILMFGLVFGGWLLLAGVAALILTLVPWLVDAMREYGRTIDADRTGHLDSGPAPRVPSLLLSVLAVLFVGGVLFQTGLLPPGSASGAGATASGSPGPSGPAPSGPAPSGAPAPSAGPASPAPSGDVTITAQGIAFVEPSVTGPAGKPFTVVFINDDSGIDHNVAFKDGSGASVWQGEPIKGVKTVVYDVPSLPAGAYTFVCTIHSNMTGTATLQ
jgi:plastocyanin